RLDYDAIERGVAGLGAAAVYSGSIEAPFLAREFGSPPTATATGPTLPPPPCPPGGTLPVAYGAVTVNVLNASDVVGLARRTGDDLVARGFVVGSLGNYPTTVTQSVELYFGEAGIAAAYTLASQVSGARLVLDTRADESVDLVVLDPGAELVGVQGCVSLDQARVSAVPGPTPTEAADTATEDDAGLEGSEDSNPGPEGELPADEGGG
ncbi:MAG TPA: LytR C-terminal domain-containing protein, partial [Actinotalea sp.]|nr:LytR C-terminal domain-containing protein [Actinotalea sp.]